MFSNGLVNLYKSGYLKSGYLNLDEVVDKKYLGKPDTFKERINSVEIDNNKYFVKFAGKNESDASVLLSQVYNKAGIESAVYTPALTSLKDRMAVVSNDVKDDKSELIKGSSFFKELSKGFKYSDNGILLPKISGESSIDYKDYFTKDGIKDFLKMQLFNFATFDYEGNTNNYYFSTNENNKINGVVTLDHGSSSKVQRIVNLPNYLNSFKHPILLDDIITEEDNFGYKIKGEVINQFKTNETINEIVNSNELAEQIGNIDVEDIASEIKDTIGYKISSDYSYKVANSLEHFANDLVK